MKFRIVFATLVLSGCVEIKAPDNLVSDTVNVSKEIYHSVKESISEHQVADNEFAYSYEIQQDESLIVAVDKCTESAIEEAKKSLNKYRLTVKETRSHVENINGQYVLKCSVSI